jgi:hypothetical protein
MVEAFERYIFSANVRSAFDTLLATATKEVEIE